MQTDENIVEIQKNKIVLKGRLKLIASKVPASCSVCDIGTDHGYIPIYLVKEGICQRAVAADINPGPVDAAREHIRLFGLEHAVEARQGNGLQPINEGEAEVIVICGMGGILISEILNEGLNKAKQSKTLVLQPMNAPVTLRKWLCDNGFEIFDEELTAEGEKIYNVISARWTGEVCRPQEINFYVGEMLIKKKDPLLARFLSKRLKQAESVLRELSKANCVDNDLLREYNWLKDSYTEILEQTKGW